MKTANGYDVPEDREELEKFDMEESYAWQRDGRMKALTECGKLRQRIAELEAERIPEDVLDDLMEACDYAIHYGSKRYRRTLDWLKAQRK